MKTLRALLVLGRVSNLPTIWSNCLCGWLLGMGFSGEEQIDWFVFGLLTLGATGLYIGGMYLNDACDALWDRKHRPERPIPAGLIEGKTVWLLGIGMMAGGMFFICLQGGTTALLALCLFNLILIYNFLHKGISWSPLLIAGCRLLLILMAACHAYIYSVGLDEAPASFFMSSTGGVATWTALALFAYVAGLGWLAKVESEPGLVRVWPCLLLALPIGIAVLRNSGEDQRDALMMSAILGLWVLRSLRTTFWVEQPDIGRTVGGLLAGIVLVDLLAVAALVPSGFAVVFVGLFALALAAQRWVPAT